ncbi:hypothetical protein LIER_08671 [Lithospermum erythrorhizon]|uniref:CCHC-type domain-containing protein n=1 Tax=Lithospermum erythrorhizon TaxID=34254 RepID=A0AAV3PDQ9_LITER
MIAGAKTVKEAWGILMVSYKGVDRAQKSKLQTLIRLYDRCEMTSTETVERYFSRLTDLVNKIRLYGDEIRDGAVVEKILRTIPIKYAHIVASITESHDTQQLSVVELKGMMESHIERVKGKAEPLIEEALKSQVTLKLIDFGQGRGRFNRDRGRGRGRGRWSSPQRSSVENFKQDKFSFNCYKCEKYGHKIVDCWYNGNNSGNQANIVQNYSE